MHVCRRSVRFAIALAILLAATVSAAAEEPIRHPAAIASRSDSVKARINYEYAGLENTYKYLHSHPELSYQEAATAAKLAQEMQALGFEVTTKIGGHGIVCLYRNGAGPTVLVRTDLDALPVTEKTGRPYASKVIARDRDGNPVGVMHACGHDMHMTCWLGTAKVLVALKDRWKGTLMFIGQPAEEVGGGAKAMLADGLFKRFPKPDYGLALHCDARQKAGTVTYTDGLAMANVDSVDVVVKGKGGHGASPHTTVDPIVLSAKMILDFQTIVSREIDPVDPAVVTVGSIHGGTKHNIIPNEVKMQLTVRSTKEEVRAKILEAIKRIAKGQAQASRAAEPEVTVIVNEFTPALSNDRKLTRRMVSLFSTVIGQANVLEKPVTMGGEDFSRYGREGVPILMYFIGTMDDERWTASKKPGAPPLASMHSDSFWPVIEPTLRTGVLTMSMAVLDLVGK